MIYATGYARDTRAGVKAWLLPGRRLAPGRYTLALTSQPQPPEDHNPDAGHDRLTAARRPKETTRPPRHPRNQTVGVSVSAYYQQASGERSERACEDQRLTERIGELHEANYAAYGYRRMSRALTHASEDPGRDQLARHAPEND